MPTTKKPTAARPAPAKTVVTLKPAHISAPAQKLLARAAGQITITSDEALAVASEQHKAVRDMIKTITAHYDQIGAPLKTAVETLRTMKSTDLAPWQAADQAFSGGIVAYRVERQRLADERAEAERLARVADEEARRAAVVEKLEAAAESTPSPEVAEALKAEIAEVSAAPVVVPAVQTVVPASPAGSGMAKTYECQVVDRAEALAAIALPLVLKYHLPRLATLLTESLSAPQAKKLTDALASAALRLVNETPAPGLDVVDLNQPALNKLAQRQQTGMSYRGLAATPKHSLRYRG